MKKPRKRYRRSWAVKQQQRLDVKKLRETLRKETRDAPVSTSDTACWMGGKGLPDLPNKRRSASLTPTPTIIMGPPPAPPGCMARVRCGIRQGLG